MSAAPSIRFIDAATAERLLDLPSLIEALRQGHRDGVDASERMLLAQSPASEDAPPDHLLVYAAWQRRQALGVKLATVFPGNAKCDLPSIASVFVLFDGENGAPVALIDAAPLTIAKTAADSALGADYLARRDVRTIAMIGAGLQAPAMLEAHLAIRPTLERVLVWNRTRERAEVLAARFAARGLDARAVPDVPAATKEADVICCATASHAPILRGAWVRPGTHVDLVGGFTPEMRESDDALIARARVYVDSLTSTLGLVGDLTQPIEAGVITGKCVIGDLFELAQGKVEGRTNSDEITLFKNGGGGHLDLMAARFVISRAN
ncbi:MAG: ornithine cyclodeaminase family protein [Acetobacteraceae bacterium]